VREASDAVFLASWWAGRKTWPGVLPDELVAQSEQESAPSFPGTPGHHPQDLATPMVASVPATARWRDDQTPLTPKGLM
jgi:hypothetical protein